MPVRSLLCLSLLLGLIATEGRTQDPQEQYHHAVTLLGQGDYVGAEKAIQKVLSRYPELPEALTVAGIAARGQGSYDKAVGLLEKALVQKPNLVAARSNLSRAYVGIRKYSLALVHMELALKSVSDDQHFYEWLGLFLLDQTGVLTESQSEDTFGRYHRVLEAISEADVAGAEAPMAGLVRLPRTDRLLVRLAETGEEGHRNIGFWVTFLVAKVQFRRGEAAAALQGTKTLATLFPQDAGKLHALGLLLQAEGHNREALPLLKMTVQLTGKDAQRLRSLGLSYGLSLQHNRAIEVFEEAVRLKPEEPAGYWPLAVGYEVQGRQPEAEATLRKLLALDPNHVEARHHLGLTLYRQGRLEEAQSFFQEVLQRASKHVDALYHHALCQYRKRDYGSSKKLLGRVLELDSQHIPAHYKMAQVLQKLGQRKESERFLSAFRRLREAHEAKTQGPRIYGTAETPMPAFVPPQ